MLCAKLINEQQEAWAIILDCCGGGVGSGERCVCVTQEGT